MHPNLTNLVGEPLPAENLTWSATKNKSKKAIVNVSAEGEVTPVREGTTTVTVKTNTGKTDTVKVQVYDPAKPTAVELEETGTLKLPLGGTLTLHPNLTNLVGEPLPVENLTWSATKNKSKKTIVTMSAEGEVTPVREGTTTITVKTSTGKTDTVKVQVYDPAKPTTVELAETGTLKLPMGTTAQLSARVQNAVGEELSAEGLKWSTSSKKIVKVSEDGTLTPVKKGTATVTVTTANGKTDTVKVKVVSAPAATATPEPTASPEPTATPEPEVTPAPDAEATATPEPDGGEQE